MDKKKVLIGAGVAVAAVVLYKMASDNASNSSDPQPEAMQDTVEVPVYSQEKSEYNVLCEKLKGLSGKYPPESWSKEQIQQAINDWTAISSALKNYLSLMGKMGQSAVAKQNADKCFDLVTAQKLESSAQAEYEVYQKKKAVYDQIVAICKKYGISASDLGITSVYKNTLTQMNNALTKANQLAGKKEKYDQIVAYCTKAGAKVTTYLGNTKWYNATLNQLNTALVSARQAYDLWVDDKARRLVFAACRDLLPYVPAAQGGYVDPTKSVDWAKSNLDGSHKFTTFPFYDQYAITPSTWEQITNACRQDANVNNRFKEIFTECGLRYPAFTCQAHGSDAPLDWPMATVSGVNWPWYRSVYTLVTQSTHFHGRDNCSHINWYVEHHYPPFDS